MTALKQQIDIDQHAHTYQEIRNEEGPRFCAIDYVLLGILNLIRIRLGRLIA